MNDTTIIIKNEFEKMKLIRLDIKKTFNEIETKINTLKTIYIELLNTHQDNTYIFGIDSFHFQNKMIESEIAKLLRFLIQLPRLLISI